MPSSSEMDEIPPPTAHRPPTTARPPDPAPRMAILPRSCTEPLPRTSTTGNVQGERGTPMVDQWWCE